MTLYDKGGDAKRPIGGFRDARGAYECKRQEVSGPSEPDTSSRTHWSAWENKIIADGVLSGKFASELIPLLPGRTKRSIWRQMGRLKVQRPSYNQGHRRPGPVPGSPGAVKQPWAVSTMHVSEWTTLADGVMVREVRGT